MSGAVNLLPGGDAYATAGSATGNPDATLPSGVAPRGLTANLGAPAVAPNFTPEMRRMLRTQIDRERRRIANAPADGLLHGNAVTYDKGCRCDDCRKAASAARQRRRVAQRQRPVVCRGNRHSYDMGCRCWECREAKSRYANPHLYAKGAS